MRLNCFHFFSITFVCSLFTVHAVNGEDEVCELVSIVISLVKPVIDSACD